MITERELFKVGILLGASLAQLNELQLNTTLERTKRTELLLFNDALPQEVTSTEYNIDTEN